MHTMFAAISVIRSAILVMAAIFTLTGCVNYNHVRQTANVREVTSFSSFLMMGNANKVRTAVKDATYSRTVSVGALTGQGDSGMVTASGEALGEMIGTAARKTVTP